MKSCGLMLLLMGMTSILFAEDASSIPSSTTHASSEITRDPTRPFSGKVLVSGRLDLKSILIGKGRRIALINDTFVKEGEQVGTAKIIAIHPDSVVLIDSGRTETLYLFANDIRKVTP